MSSDCGHLSNVTPTYVRTQKRKWCPLPGCRSSQEKNMHFLLLIFSPQFFVQALFDYDPSQDPAVPCKDAAVSFKRGDVLQIVSLEDDTWWQACHLRDGSSRAGLIPSQQLHERCPSTLSCHIESSWFSPVMVLCFIWCPTGELHCSDPKLCSSLGELNHQVLSQHLSINSPHLKSINPV